MHGHALNRGLFDILHLTYAGSGISPTTLVYRKYHIFTPQTRISHKFTRFNAFVGYLLVQFHQGSFAHQPWVKVLNGFISCTVYRSQGKRENNGIMRGVGLDSTNS